ncbi:hypothetical protein GK237_19560 [Salmonella enterica]|nr:hypothetical protein [Salmonella enterica]
MKANHILISKIWIFYSLFLLSPGILAADNLNFNYTREGVLGLDPRLGLQAKACHSKGDPMDIRIRFDKNVNIKGIENMVLQINGKPYFKSYAIFSSPVKIKAGSDTGFVVPWGGLAKGTVKVNEFNGTYIPAVPEHYDQPFCFSNGGARYYSVLYPPAYSFGGLIPIFRDSPYYVDGLGTLNGGDFDAKCKSVYQWAVSNGYDRDDRFYWPYGSNMASERLVKYTDIVKKTGKDDIQKGIETNGVDYLYVEKMSKIFFSVHVPYQPPRTDTTAVTRNYSVDENCTTSSCSFTFLVGNGNNGNVIQDGSEYLVKLNNRNIESLVLTVNYKNAAQDVWQWKPGSNHDSNNLYNIHYYGGAGTFNEPELRSDDPYNVAGFYMKGKTPDFYSGTLVNQSMLNVAYLDYVKKNTPLSLPAVKNGSINLVNTDSLTFTLGARSDGKQTLSIFGQPLKFAPLFVDGKEIASAMQIRNACY